MKDQEKLLQLFIEYPLFFYAFISKHYPLSEKQIDFLSDNLDWSLIALNEVIEFSIALIEKYINRLNKGDLGGNKKINENKNLLRHFNMKPRFFILSKTSLLPIHCY
jgi:hypothetical protein